MGCTPVAGRGGNQGQAMKQYLANKDQAKQSQSFNAVLIFYGELFPLAEEIIEKCNSFEDYMIQLDKFTDVIQQFKKIDALASLVQSLSTLTTSVRPTLQASKPVLISTKEESANFMDKYHPYKEDFKPYFDLLKVVQEKKSKVVEPKKRFEHGKLVIQYGKSVSDQYFKNNEKIDQNAYKAYVKYIEGLNLIDNITKLVAKINDLLQKEIPLSGGKKVRDFLISNQQNAGVSGTRSAINKIATTIEQSVSKVESLIGELHVYKFPELQFEKEKLSVNVEKVGGKTDVIKSLPADFVESK